MFSPFSSLISPTFWGKFDEVKVEVLKQNEYPVPICGFYAPHDMSDVNPIISVDNNSFDIESKGQFGAVKVPGILKTTLSLEHFKAQDYNGLIQTVGQTLLGDLFSEEGLQRMAENPSVLATFFILSYADLKKYKFLFWFGFPAVNFPAWETRQISLTTSPVDVFSNYEDLIKKLRESGLLWRAKGTPNYFLGSHTRQT